MASEGRSEHASAIPGGSGRKPASATLDQPASLLDASADAVCTKPEKNHLAVSTSPARRISSEMIAEPKAATSTASSTNRSPDREMVVVEAAVESDLHIVPGESDRLGALLDALNVQIDGLFAEHRLARPRRAFDQVAVRRCG